MKRIFEGMIGCLALLTPAVAGAQVATGPYVNAGAGVGVFGGSLRSAEGLTKVGANAGPIGSAALGWRFGNGLRLELQGNYQSNGVSDVLTRRTNGLLEPLTNVNGRIATYSVMSNAIYDIPAARMFGPVQPYVGVGVGYGWLNLSGVHGNGYGTFDLPENNTYTASDSVNFGTAGAFAYQGLIGASLPLSLHGLKLGVEYRFFGTTRADVPVTRVALGNNTVNGVIPSSLAHNDFNARDNVFMLSLRYDFNPR